MLAYRPVLVVWNCYHSHLSCFHICGQGVSHRGVKLVSAMALSVTDRFTLVKDQRKAASTSSYNSLATKYNAKITFWESERLSTTGTYFMSWMLLTILTSHNRTHAEKLMKSSTHVQQSLRAGVYVLTVTSGRCVCFNSDCGQVCMF
jgi:hypothetical protein